MKVPGPDGGSMMLADGLKNAAFLTALAELIEKGTAIAGEKGELRGVQTTAYSELAPQSVAALAPKPVGAEQSNTSIIYGKQLILKFFRRIQEGINPDLEIGQFLTEKTSLKSVPLSREPWNIKRAMASLCRRGCCKSSYRIKEMRGDSP